MKTHDPISDAYQSVLMPQNWDASLGVVEEEKLTNLGLLERLRAEYPDTSFKLDVEQWAHRTKSKIDDANFSVFVVRNNDTSSFRAEGKSLEEVYKEVIRKI